VGSQRQAEEKHTKRNASGWKLRTNVDKNADDESGGDRRQRIRDCRMKRTSADSPMLRPNRSASKRCVRSDPIALQCIRPGKPTIKVAKPMALPTTRIQSRDKTLPSHMAGTKSRKRHNPLIITNRGEVFQVLVVLYEQKQVPARAPGLPVRLGTTETRVVQCGWSLWAESRECWDSGMENGHGESVKPPLPALTPDLEDLVIHPNRGCRGSGWPAAQ